MVFGLLGLGLIAVIVFFLYWVVIVGGAILMVGFLLIVGVYIACIENLGPELTWSIIVIIGAGIFGFLLYKNILEERAEAARQAEEERLRAIAMEAERKRKADLDAANKFAVKQALAKPWHDRNWDDWKRVWFN
tara:strand:+ start:2371 stop:2772 length:402 start_codon:yes stop_codon:yes gene_type:complete